MQKNSIDYREFFAQLIDFASNTEQLLDVAQDFVDRLHEVYTSRPPHLSMEKGMDDWVKCSQLFCKSPQGADQLQPDPRASLRILACYAPMGKLLGCVMQNMANPVNCHLPLAAHVHSAQIIVQFKIVNPGSARI